MASLKISADVPAALVPFTSPARYKVAYGGRGSAKSWTVARLLVIRALQQPIRVLCARETQKSITESVHKLIKDQIDLMGLAELFTVTENKISSINGSEFTFAGIRQQGITNLKSYEGVDVCWCEEAQVITKRSWDVLIPTIRKPGSEIWITFNPELDTDETYQRFVLTPPEDAVIVKVNYSENPWFPDELDREREQWLKRDPEGYKTVWLGECRPAVEGAIYAKEIALMQEQGRVCNAPYDATMKVHTVWDLGWNDMMSIALIQRSPSGEVRIIDYIEDSHRTLDSYVMQLQDMRLNWGQDFIPHDGRTKDFKSGKSTEEILQSFGRTVTVLGREDVEEGIRQARMMLSRVWVDKKATALINRLKRYRRTQNQSTGEFGPPLHDENSHGADCLRYVAMSEQQMSNESWGGVLKYPSLSAA